MTKTGKPVPKPKTKTPKTPKTPKTSKTSKTSKAAPRSSSKKPRSAPAASSARQSATASGRHQKPVKSTTSAKAANAARAASATKATKVAKAAKAASQRRSPKARSPRLVLRPLAESDHEAVVALQLRCYPGMKPWTPEQFASLVRTFPEGQIGVELDGALVANSHSLVVDLESLDRDHTWSDACDYGTIRNHDPEGDSLYGIEISVDPDQRGLRLARRLYDARKALVRGMNLRRILIGGRMPRYGLHAERLTPEQYVAAVVAKEMRDPVITAQLANGFTVLHVLRGYIPSDLESRGNALLMEWSNPDYVPRSGQRPGRGRVRVAAVQYHMRPVRSFEDFTTQCEFFIDTAGEYQCDFVLFPELLTNQLLGLVPAARPGLSARMLDRYTQLYIDAFQRMAMGYNVNIIGGSHLTVMDDTLYNIAYLFRRDGSVERQVKLHITPAEARWWGTTAGDKLEVFDTDRGKVAILICYDAEFPELARIATSKGAQILFVPYNTDIRPGHLRVRYATHARCIENHVYAVLSGACGNLPSVEGADIHYAQSAILTPSDIAFSRDGVGAEATPNVETMLVHDMDLDVLRRTRRTGTVRPWMDRRLDLYEVRYRERGVEYKA